MLLYRWRGYRARPEQLPPEGDWRVWLILAGRGFGKTRAGAEWVREQVEEGRARRIALVGETASDVRKVMIEGESGILAVSDPDFRPLYEPSKHLLTWPNGAIATAYSGDEPDQLRGPEHDAAWMDELAKWHCPRKAFDNLEMGLRLGTHPKIVVTTTPRPIRLIRDLLNDSKTVVTRGSTFDNRDNLAPGYLDRMAKIYEGTRLGQQELYAELLEDVPGALWTRSKLEELRVVAVPCEFNRIVVALDPAVTSGEDSNETGIIVAGLGANGRVYVLQDLSGRFTPAAWSNWAIRAYRHYQADLIVGEANNGGDLIENTLRTLDRNVAYRSVHASRGKLVRAEPVSALYERGWVHHVGPFRELEEQMCTYVPGEYEGSPDRMDALVWALTELCIDPQPVEQIIWYEDRKRISPY
jgi:predicted phage terminase large subunit-like protein